MATIISSQRVYLNADRSKAVPDGHPEAQSLLVAQGAEIREEDAEKYPGALKLIKGGKSAEKEAESPVVPAADPVAAADAAPVKPAKPAKTVTRAVRVSRG